MDLSHRTSSVEVLLQTLTEAWQQSTHWSVLDTGFAQGEVFAALCAHWRQASERPARLHYLGILSPHEAQALAGNFLQGARLLPGFQRFHLESGAITLTLCVGELAAQLREIRAVADAVLVAAHESSAPDIWRLKALVRCCGRGSRVVFQAPALPAPELLREVGLVPMNIDVAEATHTKLLATEYAPHWVVRRKSPGHASRWPASKHAVVIGAGLAGGSVAHALALRGWRVSVVDRHATPAEGASGLPVGLLVPHVSSDDSPRSRMSRAGVRLMMQQAQAHLQSGQDWAPTGVLELLTDLAADYRPTAWEQSGASRIATAGWGQGVGAPEQSLWHPYAAWIKPQALVKAWLAHPAIRFQGNTVVQGLRRHAGQWLVQACEPADSVAPADAVVLCNANGVKPLLQTLLQAQGEGLAWAPDLAGKMEALQELFGTLSYGKLGVSPAGIEPPPMPLADLPAFPVNGSGSFIPGVPYAMPDGSPARCWFAGSTFETDGQNHRDLAGQHLHNQQKLSTLLPHVAQALEPNFAHAFHWQSSRCVSHDRLPLVGALEGGEQPSLWISAAMGARGLSFAALCAELVAAEMEGEPFPLEASLAKALAVGRPRRKRKP